MNTDQSHRAHEMAKKYASGTTLQEIGDYYDLTRERVRQIMSQELGITAKDGGAHQRYCDKQAAEIARKDRRCIRKHGMTVDEYKAANKCLDKAGKCPSYRFQKQLQHSKERDIEWKLTFAEWWSLWEQSGKWLERGRGSGYVMARHGDTGPYAVGNIKIISAKENHSEYIRRYWKQVRSGDRPLPANCSKLREYIQ